MLNGGSSKTYDVLGVKRDASKSDIQKAFRTLQLNTTPTEVAMRSQVQKRDFGKAYTTYALC